MSSQWHRDAVRRAVYEARDARRAQEAAEAAEAASEPQEAS